MPTSSLFPKPYRLTGLVTLIILPPALAWVSSDFTGLVGWGAFTGVVLFGLFILAGGYALIASEKPPRWLLSLMLGAALLRLFAGVVWFVALPVGGYDTPTQQAGYVMEDAFNRDTAAWELAQSDKPLTRAFTDYRNADQYGGLLFLSATLYRFTGSETHLPLLMVIITATVSALTVPLTWALTRRAFDDTIAQWAAWGMALYPEAVLLGSSQMREAFMMPLAAAAFYGLIAYWRAPTWRAVGWVLLPLLISLPLSPPLAGILLALLLVVGLLMNAERIFRHARLWKWIGRAIVFVVLVFWLGWVEIVPSDGSTSLTTVSDWVRMSARWQAKLTRETSGWVQKTLDQTPEWFNLPFVLAYGVVRPLLVAELTAWSISIWRIIGVWRGIGWTLVLPLLVYAPLRAWRAPQKRQLLIGLSIAIWLAILIATFWGGGDQWDNPRYRVSFSSLQIALAAWVVVSHRRAPDPWLRRAAVAVLSILFWFLPWYLRRYTTFEWPIVDLFKLLGLGIATAVLYIVWDWAGEKRIANL